MPVTVRRLLLDVLKPRESSIIELEMVPLDETISLTAAELRAKYGFRTPDAIQLASVIDKKGDVFITNDKGLKRVKEIKVLSLEDI